MSLQPYPQMVSAGVEWLGGVPEHWPMTRLRFAVRLNPSKTELSQLPPDTEVSFLPMEAIGEDGSLELDLRRSLGDVLSGYSYFREGDIALAKITPCFENGKGALMKGLLGGVGFGTTELIVARPDASAATAGFIHWLFHSRHFRLLGEGAMYGAGGQKRVPDDFVRNFPFAMPPLPEQTAIASFLDRETAKIDALVEEQKRLIDLLREKRQAVISHAVTKGLNPDAPLKDSGVEWLGEVPEHWEVKPLKHLVAEGTSITYGIVQAGPHVEGGVPYIRTGDMSGDRLPVDGYPRTSTEIDNSYQRSKVHFGDLVIAIRATVGKCLPVPPELDGANLTQGTAKISPGDTVLRDFLLHALSGSGAQAYFDLMAKGATFREITLDALRRLPLAVPPREEQEAISVFMQNQAESLDQLIAGAETAIVLLRERRAALITAAVTGKMDVRGLVDAESEPA